MLFNQVYQLLNTFIKIIFSYSAIETHYFSSFAQKYVLLILLYLIIVMILF